MFQYTLRIRDLVHGTILFTEIEKKVINHPLFQRLRQIRRNDVAFYVYPSLNTTRFEHALGTCRIAGMMAETLTKSPKWKIYARELKKEANANSPKDFVQLGRLYALMHDIGHLPLSHLFEEAVKDICGEGEGVVESWTGITGFKKLHEALGAVLVKQITADINLSEPICSTLERLMTEKEISLSNPLSIIKALIDAEIDADRIDFVQRDGFLAGGEYGHYDTRRLCDSVFLEQDEQGWLIAYSEKAITSMEALLLDRYRTYTWIHYHHRVVAMKMLVGYLINQAFQQKLITKEMFCQEGFPDLPLRDDVWLWNVLREIDDSSDLILAMVKRAVFFREKENALLIWKDRPSYHEFLGHLEEQTRQIFINPPELVPGFHISYIEKQIQVRPLKFKIKFNPVGDIKIFLYSESHKKLTGKTLLDESRLVANLNQIWEGEPREFVLLVGKGAASKANRLKKEWLKLSAQSRK